MLTKNHDQLAVEVARHVEADAVLQGQYWDGSRGCFIGCLAHSPNASALGEMYGLPLPLVRICESVFECLPAEEAKAFFAAIPDAVGRDGKDLTRVHWAFLASELRALPPVDAATQSVIDAVIAGMDTLASGDVWSRDAAAEAAARPTYVAYAAARAAARAVAVARAAARAAYAADAADADLAAARAAAYAAEAAEAADAADADADAAYAAAYAAARAAARMRQRDTLLRLISEA